MAGEIFISYRRADQAKAKLLHDLLKQRGVEAWYDALLEAGDDWRNKTANALVAAPIFVLMFSKAASESDDISKELAAATFQKKTVIPVRIEKINPEGAFLYELASRNWFDAFDNTEERLALLADRLAALVKGKPEEAKAAAEKLGAQAPVAGGRPGRLRGASGGWFKPWMVFAAAGALIGLVAVVGGLLRQPEGAAIDGERTAFFGFTATSSDPLVTEIATNATQETLTALGAAQVETAAAGDTQGVKLDEQLARAEKVGARYALGGSVTASGDKLNVTIRLDDTKLRATLWQKTLTGGAAQREALPVQAAAKASQLLQCMMVVRPDMEREDAASLGLVARACEPASGFDPGGLAPWRDAVRVAPKSAYAQYMSGSSWFYESATASAADRTAMLAQARAAYLRAKALDPASSAVRASLASYDIASDRPLADIIKELNAALSVGAEQSNRRSNANASAVRAAMLSLVGSGTEAARLSRADSAADPLNVTLVIGYSGALVASGQKLEARRVLDLAHRRMADPTNWVRYAIFETFDLGGDLAPLLETVPLGVSPETVACVQDAARAAPSRNATLRKAAAGRVVGCLRAGNLQPGIAMVAIIGLGDIDTAFVLLDRLLDRSNPLPFNQTGSMLFAPFSAPLRADPRFLPLVKREGIYQYWLDTKTQPDVCETPEERDIEVCRELRKDQGL